MLRRERLCDDDEEITRGGEERADMEIWWCWLLRAAVPLNVHVSLSLSSHTLFVQIIIASCISLSFHCIFSFTTTTTLSPVSSLSLSLQCVCAYLSIWMDGARAHWHVFLCTHTHSVRIHNVLACLALAAAASSNLMRARSQLRAAHITHQCTVVVVLVLLLHNNIYI